MGAKTNFGLKIEEKRKRFNLFTLIMIFLIILSKNDESNEILSFFNLNIILFG